ncbi:MAG: hypothetical protein GWP08_02350 [Nitrospiraceae bacterium]|nr:hypothetical protein [Nitrospiraceae bacterium]
MNRSLPAFALKHPVMISMLVLTFFGLGLISWHLLPLEFTIKFDFPRLRCWIPYPGAAPEQVEQEVAIPAEGEFLTIPNLKTITTYSSGGGCYITLRFNWNASMSGAAADLRDRVERLKLKLPEEIDHIYLRKYGTKDMPILRLALFREENQAELARLARTYVRNRLMRVDGVAEVSVSGRDTPQVYVEFDQNALTSLSLPIYSVIQTLRTCSLNLSVGRMTDGEGRFYVRAKNELAAPSDLENIVVGPNAVRLKDVARVTMHGPSGADNYTMDGKRGSYLSFVKEAEANVVETCEAVREELAKIMAEPRFAGVEVYVYEDKAEYIRFAINALLKAGAFGCTLALIVLFLFLRRIRATVLVAVATPLSLMAAFNYLYFRNKTLNIVTIASMIITLGMLVDNAIVVMENIYRHNRLSPDKIKNAIDGASEVALAITASTLTTIVVFVPVIYLEAGELTLGMREFAGPVTASLISSLLVALTVIPLVISRMKPRRHHPIYQAYQRILSLSGRRVKDTAGRLSRRHPLKGLVRSYGKALDTVIRHRPHTLVALGVLIALTLLVPFRRVGTQQMPDLDMRMAEVRINFQRNYDYEDSNEVFETLLAIIDAQREELGIKNIYESHGSGGGVIRAYLVQEKDLLPGQRIEYTTQDVRDTFARQLPGLVPGGTLYCGVGRAMPTDAYTLSLLLRGDDAQEVAVLAERFRDLVVQMPNVVEAHTDRESEQDEIQLDIDESQASKAGITPLTVARSVDFALRGIQLPYLKKDGREIPVWGQLGGEDRKTKADIEKLAVGGQPGRLIPLNTVATFGMDRAPYGLTRENGKSLARIVVTTSIKNMTQITEEILTLSDTFELPPGYSIEMGEKMNELDTTLRNYRHALVLAVLLIYLVMASLFESLLLPFSILTTVPLAYIGVYWSMYLTGTSMDTIAFVGALLMCGIVVNNGIVIIDHINQLRREGLDRHTAIVEAGQNRFRPVMMTALTTILGCVPLAISTGQGNVMNSLGRALVGGLTSGTLLTLLVVPVFYTLIDDAKHWVGRYLAALARLGQRAEPEAAPDAD